MLNLDDFYRARYVLGNVVRRTDLIYAPKINQESEIYLKPENLQVTGSFKLRGACYKISQLGDEEKAKGVIACSAGNHAQGVALGAAKYGIKSLICLPEGAPISKVEATRRLGADICLVPGVYDDAYRKALELRDEFGYTFIHPFDDEKVIAGQGTIGLELIEQLAGRGYSDCADRRRRIGQWNRLCHQDFEPEDKGVWRTGLWGTRHVAEPRTPENRMLGRSVYDCRRDSGERAGGTYLPDMQTVSRRGRDGDGR